MGQTLSGFLSIFWRSKRDLRVLMLGLDGAGKTTVLYKLKLGDEMTFNTIPTIGFNVETLTHKNVRFTMWDVNAQDKMRPLWRHYYPGTKAIIYVVDSGDRLRLDETKDVMEYLMRDEALIDVVLLVLANKQDVPDAMSTDQLKEALELVKVAGKRRWFVQSTCAKTGAGLHEGLNWLSKELDK